MNIPCPSVEQCPSDNGIFGPEFDSPFRNLTSELPDRDIYIGYNWDGNHGDGPPLGPPWMRASCLGICTSTESQAAADLCAAVASLQCLINSWGPTGNDWHGNNYGGGPTTVPLQNPSVPGQMFFNSPQSCSVVCQFGGTFTYTVPAGQFAATTQARANANAFAYACQQASAVRSVGNSTQCYTAHCPGGDPFTVQKCTPANTYGACLPGATPADIAAAQATFNQLALADAQDAANAALALHGCQVCNTARTGFAACPGTPTQVVSGSVPAGKYCLPPGGSQDAVDAAASQDLFNQLQLALQALGCACTFTVANNKFTPPCNITVQILNKTGTSAWPCPVCGSPPGSGIFTFTGGTTIDWAAMYQAAIGLPFHGTVLIRAISYTAPDFLMFFP